MMLTWQEQYKVKSYETDYSGCLKLGALFNYFQDAAWNHATHLKAGQKDLENIGLIWVLHKIKINVTDYPKWQDCIALETWPSNKDHLYAFRDFVMLDGNQNALAAGTSSWLLLNTDSRRPQKIDTLKDPIPVIKDKQALIDPLNKLNGHAALTGIMERRISYSDIDINEHVNNAKYIEWIEDCISEYLFEKLRIKELQVNFLAEVKFGQTLAFHISEIKKNELYIEASDIDTRKRIFQSKLVLG
ncbi:thioesterase [Fulvivirgaceae bacterium BMA10]|uniref:Thioesterase n=1 Tax=Splendidivirga corallicola TaxID=3051826 RepID=A0ABT8KUB5_9BACT|nr:thioesterase [Fulvivirgaceae bacterium BMA10]